MDTHCLHHLSCCLLLESIGAPPEADEFMAGLCRPEGGVFYSGYPVPTPSAVVDGA
jgi:hypothetical protein